MREIRLSGSEGGAGSIPVPTPIPGTPELARNGEARGVGGRGALFLRARPEVGRPLRGRRRRERGESGVRGGAARGAHGPVRP